MSVCQNQQSVFEIEDTYANSNSIHGTLYHSNITFAMKDNVKYYKNEIAYTKKSKRRKMRANSWKNESENSDGAEHLKERNITTKNYFSKCVLPKSKTTSETSRNLVLTSELNPWSKFMKELNLDQDNDENEYKNKIPHLEDTKEQIHRSLIQRNDSDYLLNTYKNQTVISYSSSEEKEINQETRDNDENEEFFEVNNEEQLIDHVSEFSNITTTGNFITDTESKTETNKKKNTKLENASGTGKPVRKVVKNMKGQKMTKKYPKFKMEKEKEGSLKLKQYSSRSSSTNRSAEWTKSTNNNRRNLKCNDSDNIKKSAVEKYTKYLTKVFNRENPSFKNMTEDHNKTTSMEVKNGCNLAKMENSSPRMKKINLLAPTDDNVFSLSSSDSEDGVSIISSLISY